MTAQTLVPPQPPPPPRAPFNSPAYVARMASPVGRLELTADDSSVLSLEIERAGMLSYDKLPENPNSVLDEALGQLEEYFTGQRTRFDVPVQLVGTPFQLAIWHQLAELGWGEFATYGQLGAAAGRPGSGRAVGGAVGSNPIPIIIGCHRVLASNNKLTGYSAGNGLPTKIWLLDHETIGHS